MAWYFVVLKTAFITPNLHVRLDVRWYLLRFPVQAAMNELHIQFLVTLCDPCCLRGQKLMRSRVVQCHVLIILFLAGRFNSGGFQTFQTELILSLKFVSHLGVISGAFCFRQELTSDEILLFFVTRCFQDVECSRIVIY